MPFPNLYRCNKVLVNQKKKILDLAVCANKVWPAVLAPGLLLAVFAELAASAFLASVLHPAVGANKVWPADPALVLLPAVFADHAASAFLAVSLDPAVWADATASTFLAIALAPAMAAFFVNVFSSFGRVRWVCDWC